MPRKPTDRERIARLEEQLAKALVRIAVLETQALFVPLQPRIPEVEIIPPPTIRPAFAAAIIGIGESP
jgi:hypothetical protein